MMRTCVATVLMSVQKLQREDEALEQLLEVMEITRFHPQMRRWGTS